MIKYTCGAGTPEEAETNCTYFIRGECTASFCEYRRKKQTNANKIRAMTDEELNELFHDIYNAGAEDAVAYEWRQRANSFEWTMEWLQQPNENQCLYGEKRIIEPQPDGIQFRTVDDLGRICIPKDIRDKLGIKPSTECAVYATDELTSEEIIVIRRNKNESIKSI